jgi:competence ComEA-like helix-hairpin-helix protein
MQEVIVMNNKKVAGSLFFMLLIGIALVSAGIAAGQGHEGGLGIKKIPLNIASASQLEKIDGVTAALAKAIVEYRTSKGVFRTPEELLNVPGLTKDIYKLMNPQVGAEGDLYCVPKEGAEGDEEDEDVPLSPSKC